MRLGFAESKVYEAGRGDASTWVTLGQKLQVIPSCDTGFATDRSALAAARGAWHERQRSTIRSPRAARASASPAWKTGFVHECAFEDACQARWIGPWHAAHMVAERGPVASAHADGAGAAARAAESAAAREAARHARASAAAISRLRLRRDSREPGVVGRLQIREQRVAFRVKASEVPLGVLL